MALWLSTFLLSNTLLVGENFISSLYGKFAARRSTTLAVLPIKLSSKAWLAVRYLQKSGLNEGGLNEVSFKIITNRNKLIILHLVNKHL